MSFTLQRKSTPPTVDESVHVFPLEIECLAGTPKEIFVYHRGIGLQEGLGDRFSCIASALQVRTLPANAPTSSETGAVIPFFRKAVMRLDCRSAEHAEEIWESVKAQVQLLSDNLKAEESLAVTETVVIP